MQNIKILMEMLQYIEAHLGDNIKTEDIASACFCSKSTIEKLFRRVHHMSVHDYLVRRRMMLAAKKISENPAMPILDIAVEYGYSAHESFARAFEQVWNCKPSKFRTEKFTELFPRFIIPVKKGDDYIMQRRHVDIGELYDLFQERKDCFFVLSDIAQLIPINEISRKAGDLAILEQMRRMVSAAGEDDVVFRIGGDEFCILTASSEPAYAKKVADKVCQMNNRTFTFDNKEIPLTLYVSTVCLKDCCHCEEVFSALHDAIKDSKE